MQNYVGVTQQPVRFQCQQLRVTGDCAYQENIAHLSESIWSSRIRGPSPPLLASIKLFPGRTIPVAFVSMPRSVAKLLLSNSRVTVGRKPIQNFDATQCNFLFFSNGPFSYKVE